MNPYVPNEREDGVVTEEEIKPGMTVYEVIVGPLKGFYRARQVKEVKIRSLPYPAGGIIAGSLFVDIDAIKYPEDLIAHKKASLRDRGVTPVNAFRAYNLNRWFRDSKHAQAYHDQINARTLMHIPPELEDMV